MTGTITGQDLIVNGILICPGTLCTRLTAEKTVGRVSKKDKRTPGFAKNIWPLK